MKLHDILSVKGGRVFTVRPEVTLQEAVRTMVEHRVGSLLIVRGEDDDNVELSGIITERDVLYACVRDGRPLTEVPVAEAMTTTLITATPEDDVEEVMGLMTTRRIRHLPVLVEGRLAGIISIGDVVKAQHDRLAMENHFMKDYIGRQP